VYQEDQFDVDTFWADAAGLLTTEYTNCKKCKRKRCFLEAHVWIQQNPNPVKSEQKVLIYGSGWENPSPGFRLFIQCRDGESSKYGRRRKKEVLPNIPVLSSHHPHHQQQINLASFCLEDAEGKEDGTRWSRLVFNCVGVRVVNFGRFLDFSPWSCPKESREKEFSVNKTFPDVLRGCIGSYLSKVSQT